MEEANYSARARTFTRSCQVSSEQCLYHLSWSSKREYQRESLIWMALDDEIVRVQFQDLLEYWVSASDMEERRASCRYFVHGECNHDIEFE